MASQPIGRWSTGRSADGKEEGGNQGDMPKAKHDGGGSIYDWQRVKVNFREFDPSVSLFLFLVVFVFFRCK
jgi:hypothetical protein